MISPNPALSSGRHPPIGGQDRKQRRIGIHPFGDQRLFGLCSQEEEAFSTLMASLGVEAKVIQELMRHASFRTTMDSYTQALDEPNRQAQKRVWPT